MKGIFTFVVPRCPDNTKATGNALVEAIAKAPQRFWCTTHLLLRPDSTKVALMLIGSQKQIAAQLCASSLRFRPLRRQRFLQHVWRLSVATMEEAVD